MDDLVVSASGRTRLAVVRGRWMLAGAAGVYEPIEAAGMVPLLPLLEGDPSAVVAAIAALSGPAFPYGAVLLAALRSDSAYWQDQAVPWVERLNPAEHPDIAVAAAEVVARRLATQRGRQRLRRWLPRTTV